MLTNSTRQVVSENKTLLFNLKKKKKKKKGKKKSWSKRIEAFVFIFRLNIQLGDDFPIPNVLTFKIFLKWLCGSKI